MEKYLLKFLMCCAWFFCLFTSTKVSAQMPPIVPGFPSTVCLPSGTLERKITNIPVGFIVLVTINDGTTNRYIGDDVFEFYAVSAPSDTVHVYFIHGFDTIASDFIFDVIESVIDPVYVSVCETDLPFVWYGEHFFEGGIFYNSYEVTGVCDTLEELHLTVVSPVTNTVTHHVCASALPYIWNGISVGVAGMAVATYTTTGVNGCDSIVKLNLISHANKSKTVSQTVCFNSLPYIWNGISVSAGGTSAATYSTVSAAGCDSTVTLNLNIGYDYAVNFYDTICASELPYIWHGLPIFIGGASASYSTSTIAGCDSLTTLNLTVWPVITLTVTDTICYAELPYVWNGISVTAGGTTAASVSFPSRFNCDSTTILNLVIGTPVTVNQSLTICQNQLPYNWNGISILSGGTGVATYNTFTAIGCDSITHLNLVVNPSYRDTIVMSSCAGSLPFLWNGLSISSFGPDAGVYNGISVKGCDSIKVLKLLEIPTAIVSNNQIICENDFPYVVLGNTYEIPGSYTYSINGSDGCDTLVLLSLTAKPLPFSVESMEVCMDEFPFMWNGLSVTGPGIHTVGKLYPKDIGCDSMRWLNVTTLDPPSVPIVAVSVTELGVINAVSGVNYQWQLFKESTSIWQNIAGATNTTYTALESGKYRVSAQDEDCAPVYSSIWDVEVLVSGIKGNTLAFENSTIIYPNPAKHLLNVKFENANRSVNIEIVDIHGRMMYQEQHIKKELITIDVQSFSAGMYMIQIIDAYSNEILGVKKVVVEQ